MIAVTRILVPIDFAAGARPAVEMAITMALKFGASLDFFHVWQPPSVPPMQLFVVPEAGGVPMPAEDVARSMAGARLEELLADARAAGVREPHGHVGVGDPAHEILAYALRAGVDLIIMGTHGRVGLSHALLGSVAEKVVRRALCPVLTVRARE